jgi:single-stranded-DNA-specific exonuclease
MSNQIYQSTLKQKYQKSLINERLALTIHQQLGVPIEVARILASHNVATQSPDFDLNVITNFLNPTIKSSLADPFALLDMDLAVTKIISIIQKKQKITIFGDYDVDGATSCALLKRFFAFIGVEVGIYIPDRILEGYGPNTEALLNLKKQGTDLVITVDCGTVSFEPLQAAHLAGLDIIVIDHHIGAFEKPIAIAVINPNRLDEQFAYKNLAAVGVSFLLAVALNKSLRDNGFYQANNLSEPNLLLLLDLVALGTVCDVMTLDGMNRAFVTQGLKIIKNRTNIGIKALCDAAKIDEEPSAYHLGFVIGPRINAGGRIGKADLGATILSTNSKTEAEKIASELNIYNNQRKDIEQNILDEAKSYFEKTHQNNAVLIASSNQWHQGVIGIVASRIKDLYNKPTAIIAIKNGIGKSSCRSIFGVDFGTAIVQAKLKGLLIDGGGHKMAAGFSIKEAKIADLQDFLNTQLGDAIALANQNKVKKFADVLDINSANIKLAKQLSRLEPFGVGNPRPKFLIKDLQIISAKTVGQNAKHIRCIFSSKTIAGWEGKLVGFAFNAMDSELGEVLISKNKSKPVSIIGQININSWMGNENIQILIEDLIT